MDAPTTDDAPDDGDRPVRGVSRRGLLGLVSAGAAGLAAGAAGGVALASTSPLTAGAPQTTTTYPFYGEHQSGITTPAQDRLHFAAFTVSASLDRAGLIELLSDWTAAAARLTAGLDVSEDGALGGPDIAPPDDTGEALDLPPSGLTITFGFGPTLFTGQDGVDRFGIAARRPPGLERLPRFAGDALRPEWSDGDLCIQACADDPQVAVHAIRNLSRIAFGRASVAWSQLGFGRTSSTSTAQKTPRNLFGFKDGTANLKLEDRSAVDEWVWAGGEDVDWMRGGSYLVTRKIRMIIEVWDRQQRLEQERVIGRSKGEGAPLSGGTEFSEPDFATTGAAGEPLIDPTSHVRRAHPSNVGGIRLLRRGYNYVDGSDPLGTLDAGLFFISFQRSVGNFVAVQEAIATDALAEYLKHIGSAVFAVPPGARENEYIGRRLFES
ncbi:deferrochelatase/peroxidase EfeB [Labedella phragmitis]|uniref:Deferrochelatase n=1 Tax=Labedella phragmitis TaxID=2498849 RepID=A0A3S4AJ52_9MICO|nr:iron uptake transporter deferrochelatase/peroxidase subunit [Labedella phragmitis]RWZ49671.1 deferrochelatase/peroxidase EfeB [Labedella phragmitis]